MPDLELRFFEPQHTFRKDGRVTSRYVASGSDAVLIYRLDRIERERREAKAWRRAKDLAEIKAMEREIDNVCRLAREAAEAALKEAGYHRPKRDKWRKRRVRTR